MPHLESNVLPIIESETIKASYILSIVGWIICIILFLIPITIYLFDRRKINKLQLNTDEEKVESKRILKKFVKRFLIFGSLGTVIKIISGWITPFAKPIIYLYPEKEEKVKVKLGKKEIITCTYPKYKDSWDVIAKPNGDLTDIENGRNLYALYWEGKNTSDKNFEDGFCVSKEDIIKFLEEKLEILGLNDREANEFIVYWLPKLERNKYNLIRFKTIEEINDDMPLEITPKPDTVIRVMMQFKGVNNYKEIDEQKLYKVERKGFTVVEWGGTEV